jgi:hypothetical protein
MIHSNLKFIFTKFIPKVVENVIIKKFIGPHVLSGWGVPMVKAAIQFELEGDIPERFRLLLLEALAAIDRGEVTEADLVMPPMWKRDP